MTLGDRMWASSLWSLGRSATLLSRTGGNHVRAEREEGPRGGLLAGGRLGPLEDSGGLGVLGAAVAAGTPMLGAVLVPVGPAVLLVSNS